jgi:hypothetical protein
MGLDQYIASECDGFVGWVIMLGEVIDVAWSSTINELSMLT